MGWLKRLIRRPLRTGPRGSPPGDELAMCPRDRDAFLRWESEGGAVGAVRAENVEAVGTTGDEERARQDSMTNIDDNAMDQASSAQSATDAAADAAGSPAEQGGQG